MVLYNEELKATKTLPFENGSFFCLVTSSDVLLVKVKSSDFKSVNGLFYSMNNQHLNTGREGWIWKKDIIEYRECSTIERDILEKHLRLCKYVNLLSEEMKRRKLQPVDTATKIQLKTINLMLETAKQNL